MYFLTGINTKDLKTNVVQSNGLDIFTFVSTDEKTMLQVSLKAASRSHKEVSFSVNSYNWSMAN